MTEQEKHFLNYAKCVKFVLYPHKTNLEKIKIGGDADGSYVICDIPGVKYDSLYSYGSDDNIKFEKSFWDKYKVESHVYDHTIEGITNKPDYINFHKEGLSYQKENQLDTLDNHIIKNSHVKNKNLFMQMDIEGCEWNIFLSNPKYFDNFAQLVIELHLPRGPCDGIVQALQALNKNFLCVHVHGNNSLLQPWFDGNLPLIIEATYIRKDLCKDLGPDLSPYPTSLDSSNSPDRQDLPLTWWKN